jgi:guanylate kinase
MARVFVITGPSGVGKGTLIRALMERVPSLALSVSATTRNPRPGEEDGVHYHFLSREEFDQRVAAGDFVEHADYAGRSYGTLRSELDRHTAEGVPVVLEIEVQGARQVRAAMPDAVQVFIAPHRSKRCGPGSSAAAPTTPPRSTVASASRSASWRPSPSSRTSSSTTASRTRSSGCRGSWRPSWTNPHRRGHRRRLDWFPEPRTSEATEP